MRLLKKSIIILSLIILISIPIIIGTLNIRKKNEIVNIDNSWKNTISVILGDNLWSEENAYDSGHYLMIPLHYAFKTKNKNKINEFDEFFQRFLLKKSQEEFIKLETLNKLHFLYLTSQYLTLSKNPSQELIRITQNQTEEIWEQPAWQWKQCGSPPFNSMQERIDWKLKNKNVSVSYCRAIIDEELFTIAIAADIKTVLKTKCPKFVENILANSIEIFKKEVIFDDIKSEGWLFQPGVWSDGPSHIYSSYDAKLPNLTERKDPTQAWDTSHSHRFPLWLLSLEQAFSAKGEKTEIKFFKKLRQGLSDQFMKKVLIHPSQEFSNFRTNNYMDGENGLYRYSMKRKNYGYGPYELSGTILIGWWTFLPNKSIKDVYHYISSRFPLSQEEIDLYLDLNTIRDRNPLIDGISSYKNGLMQLISNLASRI